MPSFSARQIGTTALRLIGVAASEQPLSADMAQSALEALNILLESWTLERLWIPTRSKIPLTLVPGQGVYTWGETTPPADLPYALPVKLELCLLTVQSTPPGLEWELAVLSQEEYETGIWEKAMPSSYPECVYLQPTVPAYRLHVWPVPSQAYTLQLLAAMTSAPYASWDTVLDWPTGYQRAITYGLAVEIAPQYGVEPSQTILRIADESKRAVFPINLEMGRLSLDPRRRPRGSGLGYNPAFLAGH